MTNSTMAIEYNRARVWNSAFKIAEAPMSYLNKLQNEYSSKGNCFIKLFSSFPTSFGTHGQQVFNGLKYRKLYLIQYGLRGFATDIKNPFIHFYKKKHLVAIILGTAVAYPTTLALTPVSIIADIFAGVIQAGLRLCQGADMDEVKSILHKKVIASPVQQGMYFLTGAVLLGIFSGGAAGQAALQGASFGTAFGVCALINSALFGNMMYCFNQGLSAEILPRFFRPDGFNVFIEGGATDGFGRKADFDYETTYQTWRKQTEQTRKPQSDKKKTFEFAKTKSDTRTELRTLKEKLNQKDLDLSPEFNEIRTWFSDNKPTYELFGFSSLEDVNNEKLASAYRTLVRRHHPDKFKDDDKEKEAAIKEEAAIWFKLINEARLDVETLKKNSSKKV